MRATERHSLISAKCRYKPSGATQLGRGDWVQFNVLPAQYRIYGMNKWRTRGRLFMAQDRKWLVIWNSDTWYSVTETLMIYFHRTEELHIFNHCGKFGKDLFWGTTLNWRLFCTTFWEVYQDHCILSACWWRTPDKGNSSKLQAVPKLGIFHIYFYTLTKTYILLIIIGSAQLRGTATRLCQVSYIPGLKVSPC